MRSLPLVEFQREYAGDIEAALLARVTGRLEVYIACQCLPRTCTCRACKPARFDQQRQQGQQ